MQEMGRKLQGYLNMSSCKWFRFYCNNVHAKECHLHESCSQNKDNTPMCCPDQLRLPRTCTLRRALASVHTHTHTHTRVVRPIPVPLPIPCSCFSPLPSTLRGQTHCSACFQYHGVCAGLWHPCVGEWDPCQLCCLPCCLRSELGFSRTARCDRLAWQRSTHLISFLSSWRQVPLSSSHEATAFGNKGTRCVHGRTYCWWWRWSLPPEGRDLGPGRPAGLPQSGQQGPKWPSFRLRSCHLRLWSGWWADLPEIPRSRWASRPGSRRWADRSRKGPVLSGHHQVRDEMSTASIFCPAGD